MQTFLLKDESSIYIYSFFGLFGWFLFELFGGILDYLKTELGHVKNKTSG